MKRQQQKGGSVASTAVTGLVNQDTFSGMNKMFSNEVGQCGGRASSKVAKCSNCGTQYLPKIVGGKVSPHCKKGGSGIINDFASRIQNSLNIKSPFTQHGPFKSEPAPALNEVLPRSGGAVKQNPKAKKAKAKKPPQKGGEIKHLSEYMKKSDDDIYLLRNKRGGSTTVDNLGLNYNAIRAQTSVVGDVINRGDQMVQNRILASEQVPSAPLMQKTINYGAVTDGLVAKPMPFSFQNNAITGGKSRTKRKTTPKKKV